MAPPLKLALDRTPDFRELLLEKLRIVRDALPDNQDLLEFCDDAVIEYDALVEGADTEGVTYAIGYLRGAHEAMNITMGEMFDNEGINTEHLEVAQ